MKPHELKASELHLLVLTAMSRIDGPLYEEDVQRQLSMLLWSTKRMQNPDSFVEEMVETGLFEDTVDDILRSGSLAHGAQRGEYLYDPEKAEPIMTGLRLISGSDDQLNFLGLFLD